MIEQWMVFVDGENLTRDAQRVISATDGSIDRYSWKKNVFFWGDRGHAASKKPYSHTRGVIGGRGSRNFGPSPHAIPGPPTRAIYYTGLVGEEAEVDEVEGKLKGLWFEPRVFKIPRGSEESFDRVDVQLATDLVGNAHRDNYDAAVLVGGDDDYVPAVEEAKRQGKNVFLGAFDHPAAGVEAEIGRACDYTIDLCKTLLESEE